MIGKLACLFCVSVLLIAGCSSGPKHYENPAAVIKDRQSWPEHRMDALHQMAHEAKDAEAVLASVSKDSPEAEAAKKTIESYFVTLQDLVWTRGYSTAEREYAINELLRIDEEDFRRKLRRRIVLIQNWNTLDYLFKVAAERQWDDFNPILVRQYARPVRGMSEMERPERKVIEQLNPDKTIEQVVFEVFVNTDDNTNTSEQSAAWQLLCRITDQDRLIELLADAPENSALIIDLKAAARDIKALPHTVPELAWLMYLRDLSRRDYWNAMKTVVAQLNDSQRSGLSLRHMVPLMTCEPSVRQASRSSLIRRIEGELSVSRHYLRGPEYDGPMRDYPQRFKEAEEELCWGDLLTITVLFKAMRAPNVKNILFQQGDKDVQDESTEYGGRIYLDDNGDYQAKGYKPQMRVHDLKYISSDELIEALYTSLAHYHFHAQRHRNADYAGPGIGDLKFAKRHRFNCLIFTFIRENRLNVDYYLPNGSVVDLGSIDRPN